MAMAVWQKNRAIPNPCQKPGVQRAGPPDPIHPATPAGRCQTSSTAHNMPSRASPANTARAGLRLRQTSPWTRSTSARPWLHRTRCCHRSLRV